MKRNDSPVPKNCPFDLWRCARSLAMNAPNTCIQTDGQTDRNTRESTGCFSTGSELAHLVLVSLHKQDEGRPVSSFVVEGVEAVCRGRRERGRDSGDGGHLQLE